MSIQNAGSKNGPKKRTRDSRTQSHFQKTTSDPQRERSIKDSRREQTLMARSAQQDNREWKLM